MKRMAALVLALALLTACQQQTTETEASTENDPSLPRPLETAEVTEEFRTEVDGSPAEAGTTEEETEDTEATEPMNQPGAGVKEGTRAQYVDGEYQGTGRGNNGDIEATVVVQDGYIQSINAVGTSETNAIFNTIMDDLLPRMIYEQRAQVEVTSGATLSSQGVIEAVQNALDEAAPEEETE